MKVSRLTLFKTCARYMTGLWGFALLLFDCSAISLLAAFLSPTYFQILIDEVLSRRQTELFVQVVLGLLLVYAIRFLADGGSLLCSNRFLNRFTFSLRSRIWGKFWRLPYARYAAQSTGDLKMRLMDDVDCLGNFVQSQLVEYAVDILKAGTALALCAWLDYRLLLVTCPVLPVVFLADYLIGRGTAKINERIRQANEEYTTFEHNALQYWKEVKAQCAQKQFLERFRHYRRVLAKLGMVNIRYWFYQEVFKDFKANYLNKVLIYICGSFFVMDGSITVGELILFGEYYGMLFTAVTGLYGKRVAMRVSMPYYRRILETLSWAEDREKEKPAVAGLFPIRLEKATFAYPSTDEPVLREADFCLSQGDAACLTGESGAGKSTVCKLLLGLFEPQEGRVTVSGADLTKLNRDSLYERIGVVMQDSVVFHMSIRENLLLARPDAGEEQLLEALRQANLDGFIQSLPEGLDTIVGERGVRLSGGQRQRLVIARALLRDPEFLLLDEATSALDKLAEDAVSDAIRRLAGGRTVLTIAHRPQTIQRAKTVWRIQNGKIERMGETA